jgi:two-component system sensor histidine kinase HydH
MTDKTIYKKSWMGVPPWVLIGAVAVLLPIFTFITIENINRQKEKSIQLLLEKGAALIRSFEAGTRFGMMGMHRGSFQLQRLLTETAQQPDIVYLLVSDSTGKILAHNDLDEVGIRIEHEANLAEITAASRIFWRQVKRPDGVQVFEVFRKFSPTRGSMGKRHGFGMMGRRYQQSEDHRKISPALESESSNIIFVGLDMTPILEAHKADIRHAIIMGLILLLVGFAGFTLIFVLQSYRATRVSLSRIKAFSDNVVENIPIGLIALDDQRRIAAFNNTAESVLQLSQHEVIGKKAEAVLPLELCTEINSQEVQSEAIEKEIDCTLADDKIVSLEIGTSVLEDKGKTSLGYVILFKDLTEVRSLRGEIERSRRLASIGRLAAGVAHEIRNPLSSIKGFATYFKERYPDIPQDQQTANIMIQEVDRLNRVVSQLLEFAKPVDIKMQPTNMKAFIEASHKLVEKQAAEKGIVITTSNLAPVEEIMTDPDRLNQVLLNIYLNAIESMDKGGELRIELGTTKENQIIEIIISDTGCGINSQDLSKIFDPYYTTKSSGTGLGLAITHNIVEAIGGKIEVSSVQGKGTVFKIIIPNPGVTTDK